MPPEEEALLQTNTPYLRINERKDLKYATQLLDLATRLLVQNQSKHQEDWLHLAIAHLAILGKKPLLAQMHLNAVDTPTNEVLKWQITVQKLLILPQLENIGTERTKTQVADLFKDLQLVNYQVPHEWGMYSKLLLYYSRLYQGKKDLVTAGLFYNRARSVPINARRASDYYHPIAYFDRYASIEDIDRLLKLHDRVPQTAFDRFLLAPCTEAEKKHYEQTNWTTLDEKWLTQHGWALPTREALLDLKGTLAFRERRYKLAQAAFAQIPADYWEDNYYFKYHLKEDLFANTSKMAWQGRPIKKFNKALALTRWVELEQQAIGTDREKAAEAHYLLGNACYNTSYWGSSWMMFSYGRTDAEPFGTNRNNWHLFAFWAQSKRFFAQYYGLSDALQHYRRVLDLSKDKELKAKAMYMLIACDQISHRAYAFAASDKKYWDREEPNYRSPYLRFFKKHFAGTGMYKARHSACPELKDYF